MEPSKNRSKTKSKCSDCSTTELMPFWGHKRCAYHRDCSGKDDWEPNKCNCCKQQKLALAELSEEERPNFFQEMYNMLEFTKQYKDQTVNIDWEYDEALKAFLEEYDLPSQITKNVESNVINSDTQSQEHVDNVVTNNSVHNAPSERDSTSYIYEYQDIYNDDDDDYDNCNDNYNHDQNLDDYSDESIQEIPINTKPNVNINVRPHSGALSYNSEEKSVSGENYMPTTFNINQTQRQTHSGNNYSEQYNNMHNASLGATNYPMNFQNQPLYQQGFIYDNHGRKIMTNLVNNDNFHNIPQNFYRAGTTAPIHTFPTIDTPHQYLGVQQQRTHEVDCTTGETWLYFDPQYHTRKDDNKIQILKPDGTQQLINVQYRIGNPNHFKTVTKLVANNISPFIDGREGHSILMSSFNRSQSMNNFYSAKRIPFETRLETGTGLCTALDIIKNADANITEHVFDNKVKELHNDFPNHAFDSMSIADYTSGWDLSSSSFVAFAKDQDLVIKNINQQLNININFIVPKNLLTHEREARKRVVNTMTSLHLLDLFGEKIDSIDEHIKRATRISSLQTKAIARTILPNLKFTIITWMIAKMKIRKTVLKDHTQSNNLKLLRSSLWDENLFPSSVTNELLTQPGKNMAPLLGLDVATSSKNNKVQFKKPKKSFHFDTNNHYQSGNKQFQTQNLQTFREQGPGGAQKQQHNPQRRSNTTFQTKAATRGKFNSPGTQYQKPNNRANGPYNRPPAATKANTQNK